MKTLDALEILNREEPQRYGFCLVFRLGVGVRQQVRSITPVGRWSTSDLFDRVTVAEYVNEEHLNDSHMNNLTDEQYNVGSQCKHTSLEV